MDNEKAYSGAHKGGAREMSDPENDEVIGLDELPSSEECRQKTITKGRAIDILVEIANQPPEETRGSLRHQLAACEMLDSFGYRPVIQRLSEIAQIDGSRTKGHRRQQERAGRLLQRGLKSHKSTVQ